MTSTLYSRRPIRLCTWFAVWLALLAFMAPETSAKRLEYDIDVPGIDESRYSDTSDDVRNFQSSERRKEREFGIRAGGSSSDAKGSIRIRHHSSRHTRSVVVHPRDRLRVRIWTDQDTYEDGDPIRIYFWASEDAYIYIYDIDDDEGTRQIFPNYYDREHYIRGGRVYSIPDRGYSLTVSGRPGREYLEALAVSYHRHLRLPDRDYDRRHPFPHYKGGADTLMRQLQKYESEDKIYDKPEKKRSKSDTQYHRKKSKSDSNDDKSDAQISVIEREFRRDIRISSFGVNVRSHDYDDYPHRYETARDMTSFRIRDDYRPLYGYLEVNTYPSDARIYVDGLYRGVSRIDEPLKVGHHEVRVERNGYLSETKSVYIRYRRTTRLNVRLEKISSRVRKETIYKNDYLKLEEEKREDTGSKFKFRIRF